MSKGLVVYFSQGGTTARVAEYIARGIRLHGFQADVCTIKDKKPSEFRGYDFLGIGSPVYGYRIPANIIGYIKSLPELGGLPVFSFNLNGTYAFNTGRELRKLLSRQGGHDIGYFGCLGVDYFLGYLKKGYLFSPGHPNAEELARAEAFGGEIAERVAGKPYHPEEPFRSPPFIYRLERIMLSQWLINNVYVRFFRVNIKACNACGVCIKLCPNGNITRGRNGHLIWGMNCLACLTCEMKCPKDAITSLTSKLTPDYNVRVAARDKKLEYIRVRHHHGRTEQ